MGWGEGGDGVMGMLTSKQAKQANYLISIDVSVQQPTTIHVREVRD